MVVCTVVRVPKSKCRTRLGSVLAGDVGGLGGVVVLVAGETTGAEASGAVSVIMRSGLREFGCVGNQNPKEQSHPAT